MTNPERRSVPEHQLRLVSQEKHISPYQKEHIKTQQEQLQEIFVLEEAIPAEYRDQYKEMFDSGLYTHEIKTKLEKKAVPNEVQIQIAQALASRNLSESKIEEYSLYIDGLTKLNREKALNKDLQKRIESGEKFVGLHLDVDKFKAFNENYGHIAGDYVLKETATLFKNFQGTGFTARRHDRGEEYVMILNETDLQDEINDLRIENPSIKETTQEILERAGARRAEKIRQELEKKEFTFERKDIEKGKEASETKNVTASFGVASYKEGQTAKKFLHEIEQAATYSKDVGGRNAVSIYNQDVKKWGQETIDSIRKEQAKQEATEGKRVKIKKIEAKSFEEARERIFEEMNADSLEEAKNIEMDEEGDYIFGEEDALLDENQAEVLRILRNRINDGSFPRVKEFKKLLKEKGVKDSRAMKTLWFGYSSLAEIDTEFFRDQARRDSLTGLHNRSEIDRLLKRELARSLETTEPVTVAIIDMDHFKKNVNDAYGHDVGDLILQQLAVILHEQLRAEEKAPLESDKDLRRNNVGNHDIVSKGRTADEDRWTKINGTSGRFGGEEFVIVMPGTTAEDALEFLNTRIREEVQKTSFMGDPKGQPIEVTLSIGVADNLSLEEGGGLRNIDSSDLLKEADFALIYSKLEDPEIQKPSRNQINKFTPQIRKRVKELTKDLEAADLPR